MSVLTYFNTYLILHIAKFANQKNINIINNQLNKSNMTQKRKDYSIINGVKESSRRKVKNTKIIYHKKTFLYPPGE